MNDMVNTVRNSAHNSVVIDVKASKMAQKLSMSMEEGYDANNGDKTLECHKS